MRSPRRLPPECSVKFVRKLSLRCMAQFSRMHLLPFPNVLACLVEWFRARVGGDAVTATREYQNAASISSGKPGRRGTAPSAPEILLVQTEGGMFVGAGEPDRQDLSRAGALGEEFLGSPGDDMSGEAPGRLGELFIHDQ